MCVNPEEKKRAAQTQRTEDSATASPSKVSIKGRASEIQTNVDRLYLDTKKEKQ